MHRYLLSSIRMRSASSFVAALIATSLAVHAQEAPESPPIDPELEKPPTIDLEAESTPPLPPKVQDEQLEPTVVIREEEDRRIEEYSLNGKVYMVKVTPDKGPPFYYIDADGDGTLELDERSRALHPVQPAFWKIAEWD
ncbi:MAG: DUF2782 domain-containing protein [Xanthomonadales bacterium]|nr:DUF2782 domain-containing protein [Xanthomonadales bacterium]